MKATTKPCGCGCGRPHLIVDGEWITADGGKDPKVIKAIVMACNCHAELVGTIESVVTDLETMRMAASDPLAGEMGDMINALEETLQKVGDA